MLVSSTHDFSRICSTCWSPSQTFSSAHPWGHQLWLAFLNSHTRHTEHMARTSICCQPVYVKPWSRGLETTFEHANGHPKQYSVWCWTFVAGLSHFICCYCGSLHWHLNSNIMGSVEPASSAVDDQIMLHQCLVLCIYILWLSNRLFVIDDWFHFVITDVWNFSICLPASVQSFIAPMVGTHRVSMTETPNEASLNCFTKHGVCLYGPYSTDDTETGDTVWRGVRA